MRGLMIFAGVLVGLGTLMAQVADRMTATRAAAGVPHKALVVEKVTPTGLRSVSLSRDARGHFQTNARIDGQRLDFMVDTGATTVALNATSAARFGLRPTQAEYRLPVSTANGVIKAAYAKLPAVDVGGLVVRDVEAMVLPDEALSENLLGLSFLSRLTRFEYANGRLVLEQ